MQKKLITASLLIGMLGAKATAQVVVNEVLADNKNVIRNGDVYPDYVELFNPSGAAVNLAGFSLTDDPALPRKFVIPNGVTIPATGYLLIWCDTRTDLPGLHTGFGLGASSDIVRLYAANGTTIVDEVAFGLQVTDLSIGRVPNGTGAWVLNQPSPLAANQSTSLGSPMDLRINEWMARPATGDDWLEVFNGGTLPVNVSDFIITDSSSAFPMNRPIPPLSFIGGRSFRQFFASDLNKPDADHLDFKLGAGGETLTMYGADHTTIIDRVTFGNQADDTSQGRAPDGSDNIVSFPGARATPGKSNFEEIASIVISEVLTHTDPPQEDAIELHNPTGSPIDISHWWLSDSANQPRKYRIPAGTVIPAGGYRVFYQYQFDAGPNAFALNSYEGERLFLSAGDAGGNLTGQQTFVSFGALKNGVSVGRYKTSVGVDFVPLSRLTLGVDRPASLPAFRQGAGAPNAEPLVGPIVINEIMFHPPDVNGVSNTEDEFIELHNPYSANAFAYDPAYPTNTWRVRDGVTFNLPLNVSIPPQGFVLLVSFDPAANPAQLAAFRQKYSVPAAVPIYGPYDGKLSDSGERLELLLPDEPEGPGDPNEGFVPYMLADGVSYGVSAPWPGPAGGTGQSLQRLTPLAYGNDPTNWVARTPTPGRANVAGSGGGDSDQDGMPDAWETEHGLDPQSAADAQLDSDGDGMSNLNEYRAGTRPNDAASVFKVLRAGIENGSMTVRFFGVAGRTYTLQSATSIAAPAWSTVATRSDIAETGEAAITAPQTTDASAFFRVVTDAAP